MSIVKVTHQTSVSVGQYFIRVSANKGLSDYIIIDKITGGGLTGEVNIPATDGILWLKVEGNQLTILSSAPSGVSAINTHERWSECRLFIKSGETFVFHYSGTSMDDPNDRDEATGYQMDSTDILYIKIDYTEDTITAYE